MFTAIFHCAAALDSHSKNNLTTSVISYVAVVLVQAFEGALGRLEKHGRRHAAQLRDRAALNHLAAESNPFKEALSLASVSLPLPYPSEKSCYDRSPKFQQLSQSRII